MTTKNAAVHLELKKIVQKSCAFVTTNSIRCFVIFFYFNFILSFLLLLFTFYSVSFVCFKQSLQLLYRDRIKEKILFTTKKPIHFYEKMEYSSSQYVQSKTKIFFLTFDKVQQLFPTNVWYQNICNNVNSSAPSLKTKNTHKKLKQKLKCICLLDMKLIEKSIQDLVWFFIWFLRK